jgi:hypothetical protein
LLYSISTKKEIEEKRLETMGVLADGERERERRGSSQSKQASKLGLLHFYSLINHAGMLTITTNPSIISSPQPNHLHLQSAALHIQIYLSLALPACHPKKNHIHPSFLAPWPPLSPRPSSSSSP